MSVFTTTLHTDGGARGNPGPAAIGYVLSIEGRDVIECSQYIGETTNNQAEYRALVAGLRRAQDEQIREVTCFLDSELVVKQLHGEYRVRDADLRPHYNEVLELVKGFRDVAFRHVPRSRNKIADRLVNEALDKNTPS